jgi:ribosomal protein S18 acetylase RimI-like enzyme
VARLEARWATVDDVEELVRLREVMFEAMGIGGDPSWRPLVAGQLRTGLDRGQYFAAVVDADAPRALAGCGVGMVWDRLAGPDDDGQLGYVQSMATDPAWRSRGVARAVLTLLLDGFRARGVRKVGLHYTPHGEPLYRSMGFVEPRQPELRWFDPTHR